MSIHNKSLLVIFLMMTTPTACVLMFTDLVDKVQQHKPKPEEFSSMIQSHCDKAKNNRKMMEYAIEQAPTSVTLNTKYGQLIMKENFSCQPVPEKWKI